MFKWIIHLFLEQDNGHTDKMNVTSVANSASEAIEDAEFRVQTTNPHWNIYTLGASSPDASPYPDGWNDSGMA